LGNTDVEAIADPPKTWLEGAVEEPPKLELAIPVVDASAVELVGPSDAVEVDPPATRPVVPFEVPLRTKRDRRSRGRC
jgi:hypothetical protein